YAGVRGRGYIERLSVFGSGGRFFSRTVEPEGPQAAISGRSDWRAFVLPFTLDGSKRPVRLEISVVLPGAGSVSVGSLRLEALGNAGSSWWSGPSGGIVGGVAGSMIGLLGGTIGVLVSRRRGRRFVMTATLAGVILGVASLRAGAIA